MSESARNDEEAIEQLMEGRQAEQADVTSPGAPLTTGEEAPSSGPDSGGANDADGTASGDPLAGLDTPENPVYPDGTGPEAAERA
jgi:hypothetical protein